MSSPSPDPPARAAARPGEEPLDHDQRRMVLRDRFKRVERLGVGKTQGFAVHGGAEQGQDGALLPQRSSDQRVHIGGLQI